MNETIIKALQQYIWSLEKSRFTANAEYDSKRLEEVEREIEKAKTIMAAFQPK